LPTGHISGTWKKPEKLACPDLSGVINETHYKNMKNTLRKHWIILVTLFIIPFITGRDDPSKLADHSTETQIVYLTGTGSDSQVEWDFYCTGGRKSGYWNKIKVPSCWEQEGFGAYNYGVNFYSKVTDPAIPTEKGLYKYEFEVPGEWQGRRIRIVFEGSMTDTHVMINGQTAGPVHQGSFYRFRYDITSLLNYGQKNLLEVTVSKESENKSINMAERRADYWNFGGIFRPVFLESLPAQFIDRNAIDARADGSFLAEIYTSEKVSSEYSMKGQLMSMDGQPLGKPFTSSFEDGSDNLVLVSRFDNIALWTAETPNLYQIIMTLLKGEQPLHTVTETFGFRTFEIREGDGFYLNGQGIMLKGVNRHCFWPESGRTLNKTRNWEDAKLIKEMNMNTVRMSHYPPDPEFLDACDWLGLYVLDELGGWQRCYDTITGRRLVEEMVTRDVNHPSILFWDNGNEGGWNTALDGEFARWDPRDRPVLHPQRELNGVETMHYRSYGETQEYLRGENIFFPTEFLHGLYDGGHGAGLYDYWEMMKDHPHCGGGLLWVLADEGIIRTDLNGKIDADGNHGPDGIVGPHHEKEGSFFTIKEIWSPVCIPMENLNDDFDGTIHLENRYDFINLNKCSFSWELGRFYHPGEKKAGHQVLAEGRAAAPDIKLHNSGIIRLNLPSDWRDADVLYLTVTDPFGHEVWTWSWNINNIKMKFREKEDQIERVEYKVFTDFVVVMSGKLEVTFSSVSGELIKVKSDGKEISFGNGPRFTAARRGDRKSDGSIDPDAPDKVDRIYMDISGNSELTNFEVHRDGDDVIVESQYSGPLLRTVWRVTSDGTIRLDYEYRYDGVVELMGIKFEYPESKMLSIRWLGEGPYRVWQNRMHGTRLDIWENTYNDPVPGESFDYPEFKGYFGRWKWASFQTAEGTIHMVNDTFDNYLGIYTPRDGRDALLYTLPETGLAVLDVIPAVRNKVNATDLIGPSSQAQHVSGSQKGTLYFQFE
jgi:hypothetical protein